MKHLIKAPLLLLTALTACQADVPADLASPDAQGRTYTLTAGFTTDQTRVSLTADGLNLIARWQPDDAISVYAHVTGQILDIGKVPMRDITPDGRGASFTYVLPEGQLVDPVQGYTGYGFTQSCHAQLLSGQLYCNGSIQRVPLAQFHAPVSYQQQILDNQLNVTFSHYMTYELLHVRNTSDYAAYFSLGDYNASPKWYKSHGLVALADGSFVVDLDHAQWPQTVSDPVLIPAHGEQIIVSAYIPNGQPIHDAQLVATIDGKTTYSVNTFSSDVKLQTGHAYHMYAQWDGHELRFRSSPNKHEAIDLGLPSGLLWASANMGADDPDLIGDGFRWGEVVPNANGPYKWGEQFRNQHYDKYNPTDGKTILDPEDDAAIALWGNGWHTPTPADFGELTTFCRQQWLTSPNGHYGLQLTGPNGQTLFLPVLTEEEGWCLYQTSMIDTRYYENILFTTKYSSPNMGGSIQYMEPREEYFPIRPVQQSTTVVPVRSVKIKTPASTILKVGQTLRLSATPQPADATYPHVRWSVNKYLAATITDDGVLTALEAGDYIVTAQSGQATDQLTVSFLPDDSDRPVDLRLSVQWATHNLGASTPDGRGDLYRWGDVRPGASGSYFDADYSKYNHHGGYTQLQADRDPATAQLGSHWRMPTRSEFEELIYRTSWSVVQIAGREYIKASSMYAGDHNAIYFPTNLLSNGSKTRADLAEPNVFYWTSDLSGNDDSEAQALQIGMQNIDIPLDPGQEGHEHVSSVYHLWTTLPRLWQNVIRPVYVP